ncbi:family 10 glycosylhydrolase [Rhizobium sp. SGZ-381]|uniref:family 10 glycosylhydrolase n=1 Tax=Rhizobium sp. SGZ-381 TaxID=3342800 RepID=UPI00366EB85A
MHSQLYLAARWRRVRLAPLASLAAALLGVASPFGAATAQQGSVLSIDPTRPSSYWLAADGKRRQPNIPTAGATGLAGFQPGWFEFTFNVPAARWRRLAVTAKPNVAKVELDIDAPPPPPDRMAVTGPMRPGDWVYLTAGQHRLRLITNHWTGIPDVSAIQVLPMDEGQPGAFRILNHEERPSAALGQCAPIRVETGGTGRAAALSVLFRLDGVFLERRNVPVPAGPSPVRIDVPVPCDRAGDVAATVVMVGGRSNAALQDIFRYSVFDTRRAEPEFVRGDLVAEIDATTREPDFVSGATTVTTGPAGTYRESADRGAYSYLRGSDKTILPAWFAYRVTGLTPGRAYQAVITYPDDAERVFLAAIRDSGPSMYPAAVGMETGGPWPVSGTMQQRDVIFWPSSADARLLVFNSYDGRKAAIASVRIYAVDLKDTPAPQTSPTDGRELIAWYEEGSNFSALVGTQSDPDAVHATVDRYLRLARHMGATTVSPSVLVYGAELYPSKFNLQFNNQRQDVLGAFLLGAQRYGMKVVPELHPRADELLWPPRTPEEFDRLMLLSGRNQSGLYDSKGEVRRPPHFNPLAPEVRRWYREIIGELATRYASSPAFGGIQLRVSQWIDATLNNFDSLDWGYEAVTVRRFLAAAKITPPANLDIDSDTPNALTARYRFLTGPQREAWIDWRCRQIRDVLADIVATVQAARPDLVVRLNLSALVEHGEKEPDRQGLRERGLDPWMLRDIKGLEILDGRYRYGARFIEPEWRQEHRTGSLAPGVLSDITAEGQRPRTLKTMEYLGVPAALFMRNEQISWPPSKREPWVTSASEPAGRLMLARYAELVGLFDVYTVGDGGNAYIFSGDGLKEFSREFAALPRTPFDRVNTGSDVLVLRKDGEMFYVLNLSPKPAKVVVRAPDAGVVRSLASGEAVLQSGESFDLDMKAYELRSFRGDRASSGLAAALSADK